MALQFRPLLIAVGTLLCLIGIHEFGHIIAAWLSGGVVSDVVLFSLRPHVRIIGAATHAQEAFRAAAGSGASLIACFLFVLAAPFEGAGSQLAKDTAALFAFVELLGWSLSSLVRDSSASPDDAERFLAASGLGALPVVAACTLVLIAGILTLVVCRSRGRSVPDVCPQSARV